MSTSFRSLPSPLDPSVPPSPCPLVPPSLPSPPPSLSRFLQPITRDVINSKTTRCPNCAQRGSRHSGYQDINDQPQKRDMYQNQTNPNEPNQIPPQSPRTPIPPKFRSAYYETNPNECQGHDTKRPPPFRPFRSAHFAAVVEAAPVRSRFGSWRSRQFSVVSRLPFRKFEGFRVSTFSRSRCPCVPSFLPSSLPFPLDPSIPRSLDPLIPSHPAI